MQIPSDIFIKQRETVRQSPLLAEVDAADGAAFLAQLPESRYAASAFQNRGEHPILQPRGGFALFDDQAQLTHELDVAGADFLPLTIDSHTRQNDYERAATLLEQCEERNENLLNGYPLLAHGALLTRSLFTDINKPVSLRHGTPDARVLVEAALDAGITEIEGGGICYCLPYSRSYPIDRALLNWQYIDRLCAYYSTDERRIHRESFGPLTATMVPPCMVVAIQVLELLLAAEQGVRSFSVSFSQTGSMAQDIATATALRETTQKWLDQLGYTNVDVRLVFHQWMGAFPVERIHAEALITQGAVTAALIAADKIVIKTRTEALGIPDSNSNADAVKVTKFALRLSQSLAGCTGLNTDEESAHIATAANTILENILQLRGIALWDRVASAVRTGIIDIPFAPHQENRGELWTVRDNDDAIRIADQGKVPLPESFLKREQQKLSNRQENVGLDTMLYDVMLMVRKSYL